MIDYQSFPNLAPANHHITSPPDTSYNCVAWAAEDMSQWWQPGDCWRPPDWPDDNFSLAALEGLFVALGYHACGMDVRLESGFLKIALYGDGQEYTHAARQLPTGKWTSKLGEEDDIEHESPEDLAGGTYGTVMSIMKRAVIP